MIAPLPLPYSFAIPTLWPERLEACNWLMDRLRKLCPGAPVSISVQDKAKGPAGYWSRAVNNIAPLAAWAMAAGGDSLPHSRRRMDVSMRNEMAQLHARLPIFRRQVDEARRIIKGALKRASKPYIAFSTGKDSSCMAALVWEQAPDVPAVYFDAGCAYPECYAVLDELEAAGRPIIRWQCEPILETFQKYGGPLAQGIERRTMISTVYEPIESLLAEYQFDGVFLGLRAEESRGRRMLIQVRGDLFRRKDLLIEALPVAHWKFWDVWAYLISQSVPYPRVYDKMLDMPLRDQRVSYWAGETNASMGRWVFLKRHYPALYNRFVALFPEVGACN